MTDPLSDTLSGVTSPSDGSAPKRVLILSQAAHMDWDWLNVFAYNVDESKSVHQCNTHYFNSGNGSSNTLLGQAHGLLSADTENYYSICEIGFLQAYAEAYPHLFQQMVTSGRLVVVGGGITSPDSLISNGECFIRNYLVGKTWTDAQGLPFTGCAWVPDDFGHDSQLPVTLEAMGMRAVGFARIPGACDQGNNSLVNGQPSAAAMLSDPATGGVDFRWAASDGSQVLAHWLQDHYSQGNSIDKSGDDVRNALDQMASDLSGGCTAGAKPQTSNGHIQAYLGANAYDTLAPVVYVHVSDDFVLPKGGTTPTNRSTTLPGYADAWNGQSPTPDVVVKAGTFAHYVALLERVGAPLQTRSFHDPVRPFRPTPYWMGFYATRPALKALHNTATRTLLAAETFGYLAAAYGLGAVDNAALQDLWASLVPSTHHDYVTGTATNCVYGNEQIPLLKAALGGPSDASGAWALRQKAVLKIASSTATAEASVIAFNPLGTAPDRAGVVEVDPAAGGGTVPPGQRGVQYLAGGAALVYASAPSLGYRAAAYSAPLTPLDTASYQTLPNQDVILQNGTVEVTVSGSYGSASITDLGTGAVVATGVNRLRVFADNGNIYRFGYECDGPKNFTACGVTQTATPVTVVETGPLRVAVDVGVTLAFSSGSLPSASYTVRYSVSAGEPFVRVAVTGAASNGTSLMTGLTLPTAVGALDHGTPTHWDRKEAQTFGSNPDFNAAFEATHDFVIPRASTAASPLAAVYHGSLPAWAADGADLVGCLIRDANTDGCEGKGASGSDTVRHTVEFAIRVPTGLAGPETGQPLREARAYHTPMLGVAVGAQPGPLPSEFSLARVASPSSAMLTVAKPGTTDPSALVLRVYQPTNTTQRVTVASPRDLSTAAGVTALEAPLSAAAAAALNLQASTAAVAFDATRALTTLKVG